jgi:hypothetical protein
MKLPSTILAVILASMCVLALWRFGGADLGGLRSEETGPRRLLSPTELPVDKVDQIALRRDGGEPLVFKRVGADWRQVAPFEFPMDPFSIKQLAQTARELEVADQMGPDALGSEQTPVTLQLAPPAAEITYQWAGGSLTLELGRRSVAGRAYLRIKSDPLVYVVNQRLHDRALDMNPWEWRERRIFHAAGIESDRIEIAAADGALVLERDSAGGGRKWSMLQPARTRVDSVNLDAFLQALGRATVAGFILDVKDERELANFGLGNPAATLTVTTRSTAASSAATQTAATPMVERLLIGSRTGSVSNDRFAMIEGKPVVARLSEAVLMALVRRPVDLAAPTGSGVNPADVKAIVIRSGAGASAAAPGASTAEFRLDRDLDKWRAPAHGNAEVNAVQVQELLDQVCKLRAPNIEFRDYPRDLEIAVITLHGFDGKALDTVRIAQEKDKPATALENGDNVLRVFPQGLKMRLTAGDFGF